MSIYATADLHGNLPPVPDDAELVLIAGDVCPDFKFRHRQATWLETDFKEWLLDLRDRSVQVAMTWGNHDYVGETRHLWLGKLTANVLIDEEQTFYTSHGPIRVWGTPWVPNLPRWAFYGDERRLRMRADLIPGWLDVLMTHGPPFMAGDFVPWSPKYQNKYGVGPKGEHAGDSTLNTAIKRVRPRVTICGHIHEARGEHYYCDNLVYNVAAVDAQYNLHKQPFTRLYEFG